MKNGNSTNHLPQKRLKLQAWKPLWSDKPIRDSVHVLSPSEREELERRAFEHYMHYQKCHSAAFEQQVQDAMRTQKGDEATIRAALKQEQCCVDYSEEFNSRKKHLHQNVTRNAMEDYTLRAYQILATYQETAPMALDFWEKLMRLTASVERNAKAEDWIVVDGECCIKTLSCLSENEKAWLELDAYNRYARRAAGLPDDFLTMAHVLQEIDGGNVKEIRATLKQSIHEADFSKSYALAQKRFRPKLTMSVQENDIICCLRFLTRYQQTALKAFDIWSEMLYQMVKLIGVQGGIMLDEE